MSDLKLFVALYMVSPELALITSAIVLILLGILLFSMEPLVLGLPWLLSHVLLPVVIAYEVCYPRYRVAARAFGGILWHVSFAGMSSFAAYHTAQVLDPWYWHTYAWPLLAATFWTALALTFAIARRESLKDDGDPWCAAVPLLIATALGGIVVFSITFQMGLSIGAMCVVYVLGLVGMLLGALSARRVRHISITHQERGTYGSY